MSETNANLETTVLGYDANGNADQVTPAGQPLHEMTYTPIDQLATYEPPSVNGEPSQTTWTYDEDGDRDTVVLPDGKIIDYTPDSAGRPHTIALPNAEGTITFGYHPTTGQLNNLSGPMGVSLAFGYNGRLLTDQRWSDMHVTTTVHHDHDNNFRLASPDARTAAASPNSNGREKRCSIL